MITSKVVLIRPYSLLATVAPTTVALAKTTAKALASKACGETYAEWKAAASKTGNPEKEWRVGYKQEGCGSSGKLHPSTEDLFQGAKKGAAEVTEAAREAKEHKLALGRSGARGINTAQVDEATAERAEKLFPPQHIQQEKGERGAHDSQPYPPPQEENTYDAFKEIAYKAAAQELRTGPSSLGSTPLKQAAQKREVLVDGTRSAVEESAQRADNAAGGKEAEADRRAEAAEAVHLGRH